MNTKLMCILYNVMGNFKYFSWLQQEYIIREGEYRTYSTTLQKVLELRRW